MPLVYDDEKEKARTPSPDGSHDDLGVHPERREAETDSLNKLYNAEAKEGGSSSSDDSSPKDEAGAEKDTKSEASSEPASNWRTKLKGTGKSATQSVSKARNKWLVGGSIAGIIVASFVALFSFLIPFKIHHIVTTIEERVGQVPQNAVDRRLEFYATRYLMVRTLEKNGIDPKTRGFTYMGTSTFDTFYNNMKGAKFEAKLFNETGYQLQPINLDTGAGSDFTNPTKWKLVNSNVGKNSALAEQTLDKSQVRQFIRDFAKEETKSRQVIKRHNIRKILKKYNGVDNWKPFEKTRDSTKEKYFEKKKAFKKKVINNTVGKLTPRYGQYLGCLLDDSVDSCKEALRGETSTASAPDERVSSKDVDNVVEEGAEDVAQDVGNASEKETQSLIMKRLEGTVLGEVLAKAVPVVGWIDFTGKIVKKLDSGTINQIIYARNAQQYASFAAPFLSASDQLRSGQDFDQADSRVATEVFNGYEQSNVYQAGNKKIGTVSAQGSTQVMGDCDNDGQKNDPLPAGQLVCPNKMILQDKTSFTSNKGWQALASVAAIEQGTVGKLIGIPQAIVDKILDVTKISDGIAAALDALHVNDAIGGGFEWLLNRVFSPAITGAETGGDAYDALYAGISVNNSNLGGGAGMNREDSIGGKPLSTAEVATIKEENNSDYAYQLKNTGTLARYFSPYIKESLTSQAIMTMPSSVSNVGGFLTSTLNPSRLMSSFLRVLTPQSKAYSVTDDNPFGTIIYGYPSNDPVFTANNGAGMNPDQVENSYQCSKPAADRPQAAQGRIDGIPFDVPLQTDPCDLEKATIDAGTMLFAGTYDNDVDGPAGNAQSSGAAPAGNAAEAKGQDTSAQQCTAGKDEGIGDTPVPSIKIRLCNVDGIRVNVAIEKNVKVVVDGAKSAGITFGGGGYRSYAEQVWLRTKNGCPDVYTAKASSCRVPTAIPGKSMHEWGLAVDFSTNGSTISRGSAGFNWLKANQAVHQLKNLPSEAWHWSSTGS